MPISPVYFQSPTFEQSAPWLTGMKSMADIQREQQLAQLYGAQAGLAQAKLPYAGQMEQTALQKAIADLTYRQNENQWYGPKAKSEIGWQGAQAGLFGAEADKMRQMTPLEVALERFKVQNPLLGLGLTGDAATAALIASVKANPNNPAYKGLISSGTSGQQGQPTQQPQQDLGYTPANQANISQVLGLGEQQGQQPQQFSTAGTLGLGGQQPQPTQQTNIGGQQSPDNLLDFLSQDLFVNRNQKIATTNWRNVVAAATPYRTLPENQKNAVLAQLNGAGMDATEASNRLAKGETLDDLMQSMGYTKGNYPAMKFQPTTGTLTSMQTRQQASQELEPMTQFVIDAITPYSRSIFGWNPSQIGDALATNDPDALYKNANSMVNMDPSKVTEAVNSLSDKKQKQADFIAAQMLIPEVASVRFRALAGRQMGVEAMAHLEQSSNMQRRYLQSAVTPEVWRMAQNKMTEVMRRGITAGTTTSYFGGQGAQQTQPTASPQQGNVPSQDEFLSAARKANPNVTDKDLIDYYNKKYGR